MTAYMKYLVREWNDVKNALPGRPTAADVSKAAAKRWKGNHSKKPGNRETGKILGIVFPGKPGKSQAFELHRELER